jgi:hypothetical protein
MHAVLRGCCGTLHAPPALPSVCIKAGPQCTLLRRETRNYLVHMSMHVAYRSTAEPACPATPRQALLATLL